VYIRLHKGDWRFGGPPEGKADLGKNLILIYICIYVCICMFICILHIPIYLHVYSMYVCIYIHM
jgi:hypothetical protein